MYDLKVIFIIYTHHYAAVYHLLSIFPDPLEVDPEGEGLICIVQASPLLPLFEAYTHGLFPSVLDRRAHLLVVPEPRCIIRPQDYQPSKTLIRSMKKQVIASPSIKPLNG